MTDLQAKDILLLAAGLDESKDEKEASRFFCKSMGRMWPGCSFRIEAGAGTPGTADGEWPLKAGGDDFGVLRVDGATALDDGLPGFVETGARLLAARLKNIACEKRLLEDADRLEREIKSMAADLERAVAEQARAEENHKRTQTRYEILFNQLKEAVYLHPLKPDGNPGSFEQVNKGACEMLGYSEQELLGMSPWDLDDPEIAKDVIPEATQRLQAQGSAVVDTVHVAKDGTRLPVEINVHQFDLDGQAYVLSVARDMTESRRVEEDLSEREIRYRELFNNMRSGVTVFEPIAPGKDIIIKDINDAGVKIWGQPKELVVGGNLLEVYPGMKDFEGVEVLRRVAATGEPAHLPQTIYRDESGFVWLDNYIYKLPSGEVVVVYDDLKEAKQQQEALRRSEDRLRFIMDSLPVLVVELDSETRYRYVNPRYEKIFGVKPEDCLGRTVSEVLGETFFNTIRDKVQAAFNGTRAFYEYSLPLPDGREVTHFAHYLPRYDVQGRVESVYIWAQDLSEQRKARQDLLKAKEQAEAANKAKSEFLANMSHELRTPLNGALGMLQIMETTDMDEEQREYLQVAMNSCRNLTSLLGDILDLSRIEAGKMPIVPEDFDLREVLDTIRAMYEKIAEHKGVAFSMSIAGDMPARMVGDPIRIRQVLFNLVGNAMKFTSEGRVAVSVDVLPVRRQNEVMLLFTVEDTGIGITDEQMPLVCEPFTQGDEVYTKRFQGAGLGLMIVKRLLGIMGGAATIDSEPGSGTTVYFSLRLGLPEELREVVAAADKTGSMGRRRGLEILVAEDDMTNALAVKYFLEKLGHSVRMADDGEQVLEALREKLPDCVLMDVQMPVMNGLEAARAIREGQAGERARNVPIVALTAYAMKNDRERFLGAGMNAYLPKPVSMDSLLETIEKILSAS